MTKKMNTYRHGFYYNEAKLQFENWIANVLNSSLLDKSKLDYAEYAKWCQQQFGEVVRPSKSIRYNEIKN